MPEYVNDSSLQYFKPISMNTVGFIFVVCLEFHEEYMSKGEIH